MEKPKQKRRNVEKTYAAKVNIYLCPACGEASKTETNCCTSCGAHLIRCPECGKPAKLEQNSCRYCGAVITETISNWREVIPKKPWAANRKTCQNRDCLSEADLRDRHCGECGARLPPPYIPQELIYSMRPAPPIVMESMKSDQ